MNSDLIQKKKVDPSESKQVFTDLQIKLHCCRYCLLEEWECLNMAFPFWRFYYNTVGSASVQYKGNSYILKKDKAVLIPPNTAFSTKLKDNQSDYIYESILGKQIENLSELRFTEKEGKADHLFIHFNLGLEADHVIPDLYTFGINKNILILIDQIKQRIISNGPQIGLSLSLSIHALIFHFLKEMPSNAWKNKSFDERVLNSLNYLEKHLDRKISNKELASKANMATNSFARLFHDNINYSLQEYIRKMRIEKACNFMHHTSESIDSIAISCGFVDRQHFSKVFKQMMNISPAVYKKRHTLDPVNS